MPPPIGSIVYHMPLEKSENRSEELLTLGLKYYAVIFGRVKSHHVTKAGTYARVEELVAERTNNQTTAMIPHPSRHMWNGVFSSDSYSMYTTQRPGKNLKPGGRTFKLREPTFRRIGHPDDRKYMNLGVNLGEYLNPRPWWYSGRNLSTGTVRWFPWTPQTRVPRVYKRTVGKGRVKKVTILKAIKGLNNGVKETILKMSKRRRNNNNSNGYNSNNYDNFRM